jgi:DNA-binding MarR family transcriptional regulator
MKSFAAWCNFGIVEVAIFIKLIKIVVDATKIRNFDLRKRFRCQNLVKNWLTAINSNGVLKSMIEKVWQQEPHVMANYQKVLQQIDEISGIGLHLDLVLRKVQDAYLRTFKKLKIDLTIEQWVILHRIFQLGEEASQTEIAKTNFRNRATTSRVIGGLERKGFINKERFEGDLKRFKLELTPAGHELITRIEPHAQHLRRQAIENLDSQAFVTFLNVLDQIGENYERF